MANSGWGSAPSGGWGGGQASPSHSQHGHGLLHDVMHALGGVEHAAAHLGTDIKDTAFGLPAGLVMTVEHPLRTIEAMGKSTWQDWSPLFHGHFSEWAHHTYSHPLAPLLDLAAVVGIAAAPFTGGLSLSLDATDAGFQGASVAGKIGMAAKAAALELPSKEGVAVSKVLRRAPVASIRQVALHELVNKTSRLLPSWEALTPEARGSRLLHRQLPRRQQALQEMKDQSLHAHTVAEREVAAHAMGATLVSAGTRLTMAQTRNEILNFNHGQLVHFARKLDPKKPIPAGWTPVRDLKGKPLVSNAKDIHGFAEELDKSITKRMLGGGKKTAMKDEQGNILIVHRSHQTARAREGSNAVRFLARLITRPWKMLQVGYAPRMVVNTAVGNVGMTLMEHNTTAFTHGVVDALRQTKNYRALKSLEADSGHFSPHWYEKQFSDVKHSPSQLSEEAGMGTGVRGRLKTGLYGLVHRQEQFLKHTSVNASLREAPEVRALMRQGMSFDDAAGKALEGNIVLRNSVAKRAFDTIGDYRSIHGSERGFRQVMPFFSWDKHITLHTLSMIDEHPVRLAMMGAMGKEGKDEMQKILGALPTYAKGLLPLSMLGIGKGGIGGIGKTLGGVTGVVSSRGINPYASAADLASMVQSLVVGHSINPGEDITAGINPVLTHAIERISGTRLGTQVPITDKSGLIPGVIKDTFGSVPELKIPKTLIEGTPKPRPNKRTGKTTPFLYSKDAKTQIAAFLGVPIKEANLDRAHALADKERGKKKHKGRSANW